VVGKPLNVVCEVRGITEKVAIYPDSS